MLPSHLTLPKQEPSLIWYSFPLQSFVRILAFIKHAFFSEEDKESEAEHLLENKNPKVLKRLVPSIKYWMRNVIPKMAITTKRNVMTILEIGIFFIIFLFHP